MHRESHHQPVEGSRRLTSSQRLQAMIFHRQTHTEFARDMISAGLFPLTADEETLHRTVEEKRKSGSSSANPREEQMRLKENKGWHWPQLLVGGAGCHRFWRR